MKNGFTIRSLILLYQRIPVEWVCYSVMPGLSPLAHYLKWWGYLWFSLQMVARAALQTRERFVRYVSTNYVVKTSQGHVRVALSRAHNYIGMHTDRGMRNYNEDRMHTCLLELPEINSQRMRKVFSYSIFDGHGGSDVVDFVCQTLPMLVEDQDLSKAKDISQKYKEKFGGYWRPWGAQLASLDRKLAASISDDLVKRLPLSYLTADLSIAEQDLIAGSTATCVYIYSLSDQQEYWDGAPSVITVAQVGDTRALISDNRGNMLPLTTIHHPSSPYETERLTAFSDAFVQVDGGSNRYFQYTNTRAFGDLRAKPFGISAEPDLTTYLLGQDKGRLPGQEAFVVLVSDGVTDKASDQEIVDIVIQSSQNWGSRGTPQLAATEIVNYVVDLGTEDNASAMVIRLGGWGHWDGWTDRSGSARSKKLMGDRRRQ